MITELDTLLVKLKSVSDPKNVIGMARFGITSKHVLGVSKPNIRKIGKECGVNHRLSIQLWKTGILEARVLASLVADPAQMTEKQMDSWGSEFDNWDVCDQCCMNLFRKTKFVYSKIMEWTQSESEFVKRAGFVLIANLAVHDKTAEDELFIGYFNLIEDMALDGRNFVRKANNWALRQIGKRNMVLNGKAVAVAKKLMKSDSKAARWIGQDAWKELTREKIRTQIHKKENRN